MAITTYTELQAAVKRWLHRGDLDALIPDFIDLAEARIKRLLQVPELEATATITTSVSDRYAALPTRFVSLLAFVDDQGVPLTPATAEWLAEAAMTAEAGRPTGYRLTDRIEFERVSDTAYQFSMTYRKQLDIANDDTNWVLDQNPDIYLYGALLSAAPYLKNDNRVVMWNEMFSTAIREANMVAPNFIERVTDLPVSDVFDIRTG